MQEEATIGIYRQGMLMTMTLSGNAEEGPSLTAEETDMCGGPAGERRRLGRRKEILGSAGSVLPHRQQMKMSITSLRYLQPENLRRRGRAHEFSVGRQGEILLISQFTLLGDARKGRRPSYSTAEKPESAQALFDEVVRRVSSLHGGKVVTGKFQTTMDVRIHNYGPVTILLDSRKLL